MRLTPRYFVAFLLLLTGAAVHAGTLDRISMQRGHTYVVSPALIGQGNRVIQYDPSGTAVGELAFAEEIRDVAWGPDGLLYAVVAARSPQLPYVRVMHADGTVVRNHLFTGWIGGNVVHGAIEFDYRSREFFVSSYTGIFRFSVGGGAGTQITNESTFAVSLARNGNLYAIGDYDLYEYAPDGTELQSIHTLTIDGVPANSIVDGRGLLHDPETNLTYVTMLATSSSFFQLLVVDGIGPAQLGVTNFTYANNLAQHVDGTLVVGSWTQPPRMYDEALNHIGTVDGDEGIFVSVWPATHYIHHGAFED